MNVVPWQGMEMGVGVGILNSRQRLCFISENLEEEECSIILTRTGHMEKSNTSAGAGPLTPIISLGTPSYVSFHRSPSSGSPTPHPPGDA